jgi:hypothetical protein
LKEANFAFENKSGMLMEGGFEETFVEGVLKADLNLQQIPSDSLFIRKTDEQSIEKSVIDDIPTPAA